MIRIIRIATDGKAVLRSQEAGSSRLQGLELVGNRLPMQAYGRRNVFRMG